MRATARLSQRFAMAVVAVLAGLSLVALASVPPPGKVSFQGMVSDGAGAPLDGPVNMVFRFYDAPSAGTLLWEEIYDASSFPPAVSVNSGLFTVSLGDTAHRTGGSEATLKGVYNGHNNVYLSVTVGADPEMAPRIPVLSSPFAVSADSLGGMTSDDFAAASHTHPGTQITGTVASANNADTLDGSHAAAFAAASHNHAASDVTSGTLGAVRGGTGLSSPGASGNVLTSDGSGWTSSAAPSAGSTGGVTDAANATLTRSGSGTASSPYKLALNLASSNAWTGAQSFTTTTSFPGPGIWHDQGYVGIGTSLPDGDVQLDVRSTLAKGMHAKGATKGGTFDNAAGTGTATLSYADTGVIGEGSFAGGYFKDSGATGYAYVGRDDYGIEGYGVSAGGYFHTQASGDAKLANGDFGIYAKGNTCGGLFSDPGATGLAYVGYGNIGIDASGSSTGGYFHGTGTGFANVAKQNLGIEARGNDGGGVFQDLNDNAFAYVAFGTYGIDASGSGAGGWFKDTGATSEVFIAKGTTGVESKADWRAGYFAQSGASPTGTVALGITNYGLSADGYTGGGTFDDLDSSAYAVVASGTYKITGTGTVNFVQNHPFRSDRVIVYACPEGDEVATYTRGTARLSGGEARVKLGETFQWVTNPDIGLTAHLTPRGACQGLYVESISTTEMVVRELSGGTSNAAFDYLVYGLRIGFEESSVVQEKRREAFIPSMADHRNRYEKFPDLRAHSALERFKTMDLSVHGTAREENSAGALKAAIHEYDPATDPPVNDLFGYGIGLRPESSEAPEVLAGSSPQRHAGPLAASPRGPESPQGARAESPSPEPKSQAAQGETPPVAPNAAPLPYLASPWPVCEPVEAGDLLATDAGHPGHLCLSSAPSDPGVVGVAVAAPGTESASNRASVAMSGLVQVKVDASYGSIGMNDLLVASPTPGHAMRAQSPAPGTVVGKALEPLRNGTGLIWILVMSR